MPRRILVTGGAGFIASHVADAYIERGHEVTILDNLSTGDRANLNPAAQFVEGDLRDPAVLALLEEKQFDVISHHAAQIDVRKSVADPAFDADVNVVGSLRLLEKAAATGVQKVIFASTGGAIYGEPVAHPQSESHPLDPLSPYGCAKLSVEHYLFYYRVVRGLTSVALRYANVYGPRQNAHGEAGVIAIFTDKMLAGDDVTINGSGEQVRDFVYVGDVVRANMAASELPMEGSYNVGTGVETSVVTLARELQRLVGGPAQIHHGPAKLGEQMRSCLDASKLRAAASLDRFVPLSEGLSQTVEWFRARANAQAN